MLKFDEQRKTRICYVFLDSLCHYHCANILKTGFLHRPVSIPAFKAAVTFMPAMSFSVNLLFPLLRQNHFIGFAFFVIAFAASAS